MGYQLYVDDNCIGDAASVGGWNDFATWTENLDADAYVKVVQLVEYGHAIDPVAYRDQLRDALLASPPFDKSVSHTAEGILDTLKSLDDPNALLSIGDGVGDETNFSADDYDEMSDEELEEAVTEAGGDAEDMDREEMIAWLDAHDETEDESDFGGPGSGIKGHVSPGSTAHGQSADAVKAGNEQHGILMKTVVAAGAAATSPFKKAKAMLDAVSAAWKSGGIKGVSGLAVKSAKDAVVAKMKILHERYGTAGAAAIGLGYVAAYASYVAVGPRMMLFIPSPSAMLIGAAEGIKASAKLAKIAKSAAGFADELDDMATEAISMFHAAAVAAGEIPPDIKFVDVRNHIRDLLHDSDMADFGGVGSGIKGHVTDRTYAEAMAKHIADHNAESAASGEKITKTASRNISKELKGMNEEELGIVGRKLSIAADHDTIMRQVETAHGANSKPPAPAPARTPPAAGSADSLVHEASHLYRTASRDPNGHEKIQDFIQRAGSLRAGHLRQIADDMGMVVAGKTGAAMLDMIKRRMENRIVAAVSLKLLDDTARGGHRA